MFGEDDPDYVEPIEDYYYADYDYGQDYSQEDTYYDDFYYDFDYSFEEG